DERGDDDLQHGAEKIESVLHASHEVLGHDLHDAGLDGDAGDAARRAHHGVDGHADPEPGEEGHDIESEGHDAHGDNRGQARRPAPDEQWRVERADEGAGAPSAVEPAVADGAGMEDAVAEGSGEHALRHHAGDEERERRAHQHQVAVGADVDPAFVQLVEILSDGGLGGVQPLRDGVLVLDDVAASADKQVADEGDDVGADVEQQHAAEADVVVDKADDGAGEQPSTLHAGEQEGVGSYELGVGREFLDERGDGGPEHAEAGGHEHGHGVQMPDLRLSAQREGGDSENNDGARGVEEHYQAAAVFPVDDHAGERQHEHGRQRLQHDKGAERGFRARGLEDEPRHRGGVHPAPEHGDEIGGEHEPQ